MVRIDPKSTMARLRRLAAALPAALAAFGVALAAGSTPRPDNDHRAEAVAQVTGGDLSEKGMAAIRGRMSPSDLALAMRHDPSGMEPVFYGLTPGWETISLAGRPAFAFQPSGIDALKLNAATPDDKSLLRPARPFVFKAVSSEDRARALRCLTQAIYYEAALEPTSGQEAVAQVVLNRVRDVNYPNSICGVVFQGAERVTGCQFSFTCDGALAQGPVAAYWNRARVVAERALAGHVANSVGTATHYHADYVRPWWAPTLNRLTQIGAHIFYRWKGFSGETAAFRQAYSGKEPVIDEARFSKPRLQIAHVDTPEEAQAALDAAATKGQPAMRTVEIDGQTRVVGVASLGGRRLPTAEDIARINASVAAFERPKPTAPPPPGVTPMEVEEIGRPAD